MSSNGNDNDPERGEISREDREALRRRAEEIGQRLDSAKARRAPALTPDQRGQALGQAFRIAVELVAGVAVGGGIGWVLDRFFGSGPWLLLVFLVLGFTAGMLNVARTALRLQTRAEPMQRSAPSVKDDDEDDR